MTGSKAGVWCEFNGDVSGDIIDLWAECRGLSIPEAIKDIRSWLGVELPSFEPSRVYNWTRPKLSFDNLTALNVVASASPVFSYLMEERKLTKKTLDLYQIAASGREMVFPYYRDEELIFVKYIDLDRIDGKKKMRVDANCEPCLFGWDVIPRLARSLVLVEGEIDAMSLHQYDLGFAVLSVPFGGGGGAKQKWVEHEFNRLSAYDLIYLAMDDDEAGRQATTELMQRLGSHRCRIVKLPAKDANDCLMAGMSQEVIL